MKAYSQKQACEFGNKNLILWQHKQTTYSDPLFKVQDPYNQLDNESCTQYTSNSTGPTQIMLFLRCNVTAQYHASQDLITQHLKPSLTLHLPTHRTLNVCRIFHCSICTLQCSRVLAIIISSLEYLMRESPAWTLL